MKWLQPTGKQLVYFCEKVSLSEIVAEHDNQNKVFKHIFVKEGEIAENIPVEKSMKMWWHILSNMQE